MNIFFYATYSNKDEFLATLKKKFKDEKIYTVNDTFDYSIIDVAMVWNLQQSLDCIRCPLQQMMVAGLG